MEREFFLGSNYLNSENTVDPLASLQLENESDVEFCGFVREGYNRGLSWFKNQDLPTLKQLYTEFKFRVFVTKHELGHFYAARSFGWQVTEFVTNGVGRVKGWVKMRLPQKQPSTIRAEHEAIAAAGYAATGFADGCGSDFSVVGRYTSITQAINSAYQRIPSRSTLDSEAKKWVFSSMSA